jgi:NAD(P)H-nitrite reductase large subunit
MAVSQADIVAAIRHGDLRTVAQVAERTRASSGCGGCRGDVADVLAAHRASLQEPLAVGRA